MLTKAQALLHALLDSILRHTPRAGRLRPTAADGSSQATGSSLPISRRTLEADAAERAATPSIEERSRAAIAGHVQEHGGAITRRDLETYRVIRRRPVEVAFRGHVFESNPPPSSGGVLIGYGLRAARPGWAPPRAAGRCGLRSLSASSRCCGSRRAQGRARSRASSTAAGSRGACCATSARSAGCAAVRAAACARRPSSASPAGRRTSRRWTPRETPRRCPRRQGRARASSFPARAST